jgi:intein/homing endonuclease
MVKTKKIQIKDLTAGMKIKTKNEHGEIVFKTVTNKWDTTVSQHDQVRLEFENGVILNCSVYHPIMVLNESGTFLQKKPKDLTNEDRVLTENGFTRLLIADFEQQNDPGYIDITVDDVHTFFASNSSEGPMVLTHNSQGGIRNASATIFYNIWHLQFEDLIVIKNNQGTEETRVRHMDYGVVLSALFWRRFKNQEKITFFDPNEVPDLYEAFYQDIELFEKLYVKYEQRRDLRTKTMSAEEVFKGGILKERTDTGRIYLVYIDNVQRQGPFDTKFHTIYQSNLCCVTGPTKVTFMHPDGNIEEMSIESAVERFSLGGLTSSRIKSFKDGNVSWENISAAIKTKTVTELYEIEDEFGNKLQCTEDHRIYTKNRGFVRADELLETDTLCIEI